MIMGAAMSFSDPISPCAPNLRDVGGTPAGYGKVVRTGMLYRSEYLAPSPDEAGPLAALGFRTVVDLRSERERTTAPNGWLAAQRATIHEIDVMADFRASADPLSALRTNPGAEGAQALMVAIYREKPYAARAAIKRVADVLIAGDVPLLVHCTAGKDRTGFVCAMMLMGAGVAAGPVMADYLASERRRHPQVSEATRTMMANAGVAISDEILAALNGAREDYLAASFAVLDADFGGVEAYLDTVGVDRVALRSAFVA